MFKDLPPNFRQAWTISFIIIIIIIIIKIRCSAWTISAIIIIIIIMISGKRGRLAA